ncbi:MAG: hypothetical protein AB7N90_17150, partial [Vicinamibacterales bacterium]
DLMSFIDDELVPGKYTFPRQGLVARAMRRARGLHAYRIAQRVYHRHVRWRVQPMVFGSLIIERPDLHSRLVMANVNRDAAGGEFQAVVVKVQLLDQGGVLVHESERTIPKDGTLVVEAREMIGGRGQGLDFVGAVIVQGRRRHIGSLRPYTHYFNDVSIASTHDQWTPDATRHHGYCAMVRIPPDDSPLVYLSVSNIEPSVYRSKVLLTNSRGEKLETSIEVAPYGTMLTTSRELFGQVGSFLRDGLGTIRFDNWRHRAMYYFLAHDPVRDTWNVNHL